MCPKPVAMLTISFQELYWQSYKNTRKQKPKQKDKYHWHQSIFEVGPNRTKLTDEIQIT